MQATPFQRAIADEVSHSWHLAWNNLVTASAAYAQPATSITPRIQAPILLGWLGKLRGVQNNAHLFQVDIKPLYWARPVEEREAVSHAVRIANAAAACAAFAAGAFPSAPFKE